jgi:hypothetical protein
MAAGVRMSTINKRKTRGCFIRLTSSICLNRKDMDFNHPKRALQPELFVS